MKQNRFKRLAIAGALIAGMSGGAIAFAGSAGAQATPSSSCDHGITNTQVGEQSNNVTTNIDGVAAYFDHMTVQSHAQLLCDSTTVNANNKSYFGIEMRDNNGKYIFLGIGTRAGEYDCSVEGKLGHVVFTWSGANEWYGLSNEVYPGTDSHGCSSSLNFGLQISYEEDGYWHLYLLGNNNNDVVELLGNTLGSARFAQVLDATYYGGNSNVYGQNNGSDYLQSYSEEQRIIGGGWIAMSNSPSGGTASFSNGSYSSRFVEGGTTNGMSAYTNTNAVN